jgi:hypothetical protein
MPKRPTPRDFSPRREPYGNRYNEDLERSGERWEDNRRFFDDPERMPRDGFGESDQEARQRYNIYRGYGSGDYDRDLDQGRFAQARYDHSGGFARNLGPSLGHGPDRGYGYGSGEHPGYGQNIGYGQNERLRYGAPTGLPRGDKNMGPKGYTRSDERIREDVCDRLSQGYLDASDVEVTVSGGEVTLQGSVPNRQTKYQIEEITDQVSGVKDVHNRLTLSREASSQERGAEGDKTMAQGKQDRDNGRRTSTQH